MNPRRLAYFIVGAFAVTCLIAFCRSDPVDDEGTPAGPSYLPTPTPTYRAFRHEAEYEVMDTKL